MKASKIVSLGLLITLIFCGAKAENSIPKFGKIDEEHFSATVCSVDSGAHAYYIYNTGLDYFAYNSSSGFALIKERQFAIKILDETAFDWADIAIPYYTGGTGATKENVSGVKAVTYNLEGGKVVETKLSRKDVMTEETTEHWLQDKFSMPNVKKGSVIEVSYSITSPFYTNLEEWVVQSTIPILYMYYEAAVPEYFHYHQTHRGYEMVKFNQSTKNGQIQLQGGDRIDYVENVYALSKENIPAFKIEGFLRTPANYVTAVDFELSHIIWPNMKQEHFSTDWEKVNKTLLDDAMVGDRLKVTGYLKDIAATMNASQGSETSKAVAAYRYMQDRFTYNGNASIYARNSLRSAYNDRVGNAAEINYNLVALLRELGLRAFPIVTSTTGHGMIIETNPSIESFNYVIAGVVADNKLLILDASDKLCEPNMMPYRCINYKGRTIEEGNCNWVNITPAITDDVRKSYILNLKEDGTLEGNAKYVCRGYGAYDLRNDVIKSGTKEEYLEEFAKDFDGLEITNAEIENLDTLGKPVNTSFDLKLTNNSQVAGDLILMDPLLMHTQKENPFKMEKRDYPVEFATPMKQAYTLQINLPEGYELEETPEPLRLVLPDKSASYIYSVRAIGQTIVINSIYERRKVQYLPNEYVYLKAFYDEMIARQSTNLIIKKSTQTASN